MTEILVKDSFIKKIELKTIQDLLVSPDFPWYFYDGVNSPNYFLGAKEKYNFQFSHVFYYEHRPTSQYIDVLNPILSKINLSAILRIKANLIPVTDKEISYGFHVDEERFNGKTGIFYVNTNNGHTVFSSGDKIDSVENRYAEFDSQLEHTGTSCTDKKYRLVINFNYYTW